MKTVKREIPASVREKLAKRGKGAKPDLTPDEQEALKERIAAADAQVSDEEDAKILEGALSDQDSLPLEAKPRGRPAMSAKFKRKAYTLKLDPRIVAHFQGDNPKGWHTRINDCLLKAVEEEEKQKA